MAHTRRLGQLCAQLGGASASPAPASARPSFPSSLAVEPHLLTDLAGSTVTAEGWASRRKELEEAIIPHEYGGMPPQHEAVEVYARGHVSSPLAPRKKCAVVGGGARAGRLGG